MRFSKFRHANIIFQETAAQLSSSMVLFFYLHITMTSLTIPNGNESDGSEKAQSLQWHTLLFQLHFLTLYSMRTAQLYIYICASAEDNLFSWKIIKMNGRE